MPDTLLDNAIADLMSRSSSFRCNELISCLESLGFNVKEGKRGGHHVYTHAGLPTFASSSFDCGHGKNNEIKVCYVKNVLRVLKTYKEELRDFLREDNE